MNVAAFYVCFHRFNGGLLRVKHGLAKLTLSFVGPAAQIGAGHIAIVAGLQHSGENIDDD